MSSGRYNEAKQLLQRIPDWRLSRSTLYNLGLCYLKLGLYEESISHFNDTLALEKAQWKALIARSKAYRNLENYQKALSDLQIV